MPATTSTGGAAADRLRDIEALTDAGLAQLGVEDLLSELLDRTLAVLGADTAAVLLLDDSGSQLVATAARGLEAEVYQGVRIPLGRGFAGRIAAERRPVTIDDLDKADVLNPVLREKGLRSLLGVPLLVAGDLLGVLHVGTLTQRHFSASDVDLLRVVAERVALATRAQRACPTASPPSPGSRAPCGTAPVARATWAATGTTCSCCRRAGCASRSATSSAGGCTPR